MKRGFIEIVINNPQCRLPSCHSSQYTPESPGQFHFVEVACRGLQVPLPLLYQGVGNNPCHRIPDHGAHPP
jgi:hypothetical protein